MRIRCNGMLWLAVLAVALIVDPSQAVEKRIALVIGNSAYDSLERLKNPVSDAKLIARTLRDLGFEVMERTDSDEKTMKRAMQEFGRRIAEAGRDTVSLFYYAGHALEVNGINYLVPIKSRIERESDVEIEAVDASLMLRQMKEAGSRVNIMILDACRNNPLPRALRSMTRGGLAHMEAPRGSLIAFATAPKSVATDGNGENSPYTQALAKAMKEPGLAVEEVFRQVRVRVIAATQEQQVPWEHTSLTGAFYFSPTSAVASGTAPPEEPPRGILIVPRGQIAGRWEGRYQCQGEEIGFSLHITNDDGNHVAAIFEFFALPGKLSFPRGSFRMVGDYNRTDGNLRLQSAAWIQRPLGFQSHNLEGQLETNGATISGRVLTTGCAHFMLTRK
jgi:Caspase domain